MTSAQSKQPKRRFRFRFGLRTLLIVMLLFGAVFGVLGMMAREASRQRKVVADLRKAGAIVFDYKKVSLPEWIDTGYCGRVVNIRVNEGDFRDASPLANLDNVYLINLSCTNVSNVTPLARLRNLTVLYLHKTNIADVTPLSSLENLEMLDLSHTHVTDVQSLAALQNLVRLDLSGTQVTDEQVNELQRALPDCEIFR